MRTHLIASIEKLEYHNSQYARLTVNVLEQKFVMWMEMKLSKSTYGFSSRPFLFAVETKTQQDGQVLHMVDNIQPWMVKHVNAEENQRAGKSPEKASPVTPEGGREEGTDKPIPGKRRVRTTGSARTAR